MAEERKSKAPKGIPIETLLEAYKIAGSFEGAAVICDCDPSNVARRLKRYWEIEVGHKNGDHDIPDYRPGAGRNLTHVSKTLDKDGNVKAYSVREQAQADNENFVHPLAKLQRVSTLRGADGSIRAQWEITTADSEEKKAAFDEIVEAFKEDLPRVEPVDFRSTDSMKFILHNLYVLSDAHIGALAWDKESGGDWDLQIAEDMLIAAFRMMIESSPPARSCTVALLGDWTHYDKFEAVTTMSGNVLDSDGRQPKMNKVAIRVARAVIKIALETHEQVELLVAEGNHDIIAANWLRELFVVAYEDEPRLKVIDDPRPYYATLVGDVFIGFHHGHMKGAQNIKNAEQLVAIFADEFREEWGKATRVYIHTGHLHTHVETQPRGANVIQHPTLATRGSWEMRHGWNNIREAIGTTYHRRHGRKGQVFVNPSMLEDL
jgi:hypothetical protein